jgi:hypothetical protein
MYSTDIRIWLFHSPFSKISERPRLGFHFSQQKKSAGPVGMSMSGFERLDRLSLPRRARQCAERQSAWATDTTIKKR